jgi:hypothetical protein
MAIKSATILQPLPPYNKSLYGLLRESRAKNRLLPAKKIQNIQNSKFKIFRF